MSDRVERVARAIADAVCWDEAGEYLDFRSMARAAIAAADGPNSMEVREQMLRENYGADYCIYERHGSRAPRAMWPVS